LQNKWNLSLESKQVLLIHYSSSHTCRNLWNAKPNQCLNIQWKRSWSAKTCSNYL